jgi:hypothetical protein
MSESQIETHPEVRPNVTFDLAVPRWFVLSDRDHAFTLQCRCLTGADWRKYFAGIHIAAQQNGNERSTTIDTVSPRLALAEDALVDCSGYTVVGGTPLTSVPNWQKKIPLAHRLRLGDALSDVRPSTASDPFTIYPECEVVLLDATYTSFYYEGEDARTEKVLGLKHVFSTPSEEQHRRFQREASRSVVVGGSRSGKTIYKNSSPLLADLYDELVVSVDGYSYNGHTTLDRAQIVAQMDMLHKVIAAQELFQPQDTSSLAQQGDAE